MVSLVAPDADLRASAAAIVKEDEAISLRLELLAPFRQFLALRNHIPECCLELGASDARACEPPAPECAALSGAGVIGDGRMPGRLIGCVECELL